MKDYLIMDVKEFQLRTRNSLLSIGITKTSHLTKLSVKDLKFIYGIGEKGRKSILEFCSQNNIPLTEESNYLNWCTIIEVKIQLEN